VAIYVSRALLLKRASICFCKPNDATLKAIIAMAAVET